MDYYKHYDLLISRAKDRKLDCYTEQHHIIPRCIGGSDEKDNLVRLTPEEHYVAHQLLVKMYPMVGQLVLAAQMMIPNRDNNKTYGWIRRKFAIQMAKRQKGAKNSQYGTRWIHNIDIQENKKILKDDVLPEGWLEGRVFDWEKDHFNVSWPKMYEMYQGGQTRADCLRAFGFNTGGCNYRKFERKLNEINLKK